MPKGTLVVRPSWPEPFPWSAFDPGGLRQASLRSYGGSNHAEPTVTAMDWDPVAP